MNRTAVQSSNLRSVGYDATSSRLEVEFIKSGVFEYYDVPASVHSGLMSAASKGSYLDKHVKKAGYRYKKLS